MNRRTTLQAGAAAAALMAGAGLSWWLRRDAGEAAPAALWELRMPQPSGNELVLATLRGRPLVLNFWATWCPPCVKELPEIDRFAREQAARIDGWRVVGIAIDQLAAVQTFLSTTPVSYPIGLASYAVTELTRALGNDAGGLPFTVALAADGTVARRKLGSTSHAELAAWAAGRGG